MLIYEQTLRRPPPQSEFIFDFKSTPNFAFQTFSNFSNTFILLSHCMRFFKTKQQVFKQGEGWEGQNLKSREIFLVSKKSGNWVRFQVVKKNTSSMLQIQVLSDLVQSRGGTFDDLYNRESAGAPDWIRNGSLPLEASLHYAESKRLYRTLVYEWGKYPKSNFWSLRQRSMNVLITPKQLWKNL